MNSNDQSSRPNERGESVMELIRGSVHDARTLSIKEFAAAKLEIREEISKAVRSGIFLGVGLFALASGVVVLSIVLALLLARNLALPDWVSLAIVGVAYTVFGLVIILLGKHKLKGITAITRNTLQSSKEDARYIGEKAIGH